MKPNKQINLNKNKYKIIKMEIKSIKIVFITQKTIWVLAPQKLQLITQQQKKNRLTIIRERMKNNQNHSY